MTDDSNDPKNPDYFSIKCEELRVGEPVPVDCFAYLVKNQKFIQWSRKGDIFTAHKKERLSVLGFPVIFGPITQKQDYEKYRIQVSASATPGVGEVQTQKVHVAGGAVRHKEPVHKVFGSVATQTNDRVLVRGQKAKQEAPPTQPAKSKSPNVKVDVDFLNVVITTTQKVFQEQFSIPVKFRAPTRRTDIPAGLSPIDIASFVVLTSQTIRGTIGLCFPASTYLYMLRQNTGMDYSDLAPALCTGCCEFLYAIYELARPELIDLGYLIDRAVPTLVVGNNMSLPHIIPDQGFSVVFDTPGGTFQFEIGIKTGT